MQGERSREWGQSLICRLLIQRAIGSQSSLPVSSGSNSSILLQGSFSLTPPPPPNWSVHDSTPELQRRICDSDLANQNSSLLWLIWRLAQGRQFASFEPTRLRPGTLAEAHFPLGFLSLEAVDLVLLADTFHHGQTVQPKKSEHREKQGWGLERARSKTLMVLFQT